MARRASKGNGSKAIGYIRVSTSDQHLGTEAQLASLQSWCESNAVELVAVYTDHGVSGGAALDKRLALLDAVAALKVHGAGKLLVAKRDRLARDCMIAAMVERLADSNGAEIVAADGAGNGDGPEALLMRRMVDAFAEYERAMIKARTKAALAAKRKKGEKTGGQAPFGYRLAADGIHLEPDSKEQRVVELVKALQVDGYSLRAIADEMNRRNVQARGRKWYAMSVSRVLGKVA